MRVNKMIRVVSTLLFITILITPSFLHGGQRTFEEYTIHELPESAKYMIFKSGITESAQEIRHFIYEEGPEVQTEPDGDQSGVVTNFTKIPESIPLQDLYYGFVTFERFENNSINNDQTEVFEEIVYEDVFPYQYNFQVDSAGNIHTAFVHNYTVIYGFRTPGASGTWDFQPILSNSYWYMMMPDIALNEEGLPRIVFAGVYRTAGIVYAGGDPFTDGSKRSIQYAYSTQNGNSLDWTVLDITESVTTFDLSPSQFHALNPGIMIQNGMSYVAFNGDYPVAVSSRLEMLRFPEVPEVGFNFTEIRHDWVFEAATRSTKFRTPNIAVIDGAIMIIAGTSNTGGALAFMLGNEEEEPLETIQERKTQWLYRHIENERRNVPIISMQGFFDTSSNQFIGIYSYYLDLDVQAGTFTNDVFLVTVQNVGNEAIGLGYERVSDTFDTKHSFGSAILTQSESLEVFYLEENPTGTGWNVLVSTRLPPIPPDEHSEFGFILALFLMTAFTSGTIFGIRRFVKPPEIEEEVLPHMINLKDEISKD